MNSISKALRPAQHQYFTAGKGLLRENLLHDVRKELNVSSLRIVALMITFTVGSL